MSNIFDIGVEVIKKLQEKFPESSSYFKGGAARDYLAKFDCKDIDFVTDLPREKIITVFPDHVPVDKDVIITIVEYKNEKFDIQSVENGDISSAVARGDLTINSMAYNPITKDLIDPENGLVDLRSNTLRFSSFVFESLLAGRESRSIMRSFKFESRWGWDFDDESKEAIKKYCSKNTFNRLKPDVMQKIINDINSGNFKEKALETMKELGVYDLLEIYEKRQQGKFVLKGQTKEEENDIIRAKIDAYLKKIEDGSMDPHVAQGKINILKLKLHESIQSSGLLVLDIDDTIIKYPHSKDDSIDEKYIIMKTIRLMDKYIEKGYKVSFLTAQSDEDKIKTLGKRWLKRKLGDELVDIGDIFSEEDTYAVKDPIYDDLFLKDGYKTTVNQRKSFFLRKLCDKYDHVVFIDDSEKNIQAANNLKIINLESISVGSIKENKMKNRFNLREANLNDRMEALKGIFDLFKENGSRIYIEGGSVRDHVMGIQDINDFDLICDMKPDELRELIKSQEGCKAWKIKWNVSAFIWKDKHKYEIYGAGPGGIEKELENKDLTVNSLAWDPFTDEILDPLNGASDIKNGILRFPPINEEKISKGEEADRAIRLIRFIAQKGWEPSKDTVEAMKSYIKVNNGHFGSDMSQKYFDKNWNKMVNAPYRDEAIKFAKIMGFSEAFRDWGVDLNKSPLFESLLRIRLKEKVSQSEYAAAKDLAERIEEVDGSRTLIVGGYVRDSLIGDKDSHDIDLVTDMEPKVIGKNFKKETIGYKWRNHSGVYIINHGGFEFELRTSKKGWLEKDLYERDITINSIAIDPLTGDTIDPLNGESDIQSKILRFTPSSFDSIKDQRTISLRILRLIRFYAILPGDWTVDKKTKEACKIFGNTFDSLSVSARAFKHNWEMIQSSGKQEETLKLIEELGLQEIFDKLLSNKLEESLFSKRIRIREDINPDGSMFVYSSSKDSELYKYFFNRSLRFAQNAGNAYGFGLYAIMDLPEVLDNIGYSDAQRKSLYGENMFKFKVSPDRFFFLDYNDYNRTKRGASSEPENFLIDQFNHFGIKRPPQEVLEIMTGDASGKAAAAFYKYMASIYYQNYDGTLNSPINGFIYIGKRDGHTAVIWNPYSLIPVAVSHDTGATWEKLSFDSPEYKEYMDSAENDSTNGPLNPESEASNIDRIFSGNKTDKNKKAYDLLLKYGEEIEGICPGFFSHIIIKPDGGIDCAYKSNTPMVDGYRHLFRIMRTQSVDQLHKEGFYFNKMDAGIKFGASSSKGGEVDTQVFFDFETVPDYYVPREIGDCIALWGMKIDDFSPLESIKMNGKEKVLRLTDCDINGIKGIDYFDKLEFSGSKPSYVKDESLLQEILEMFPEAEGHLELERPAPKEKKAPRKKAEK